jgi:hypothetical protein
VFYEFFPETDESSWHLDEFVDADGAPVETTLFTASRRVTVNGPMRCTISHAGRATDLTFGPFFVPVVCRALSRQLAALAPRDLELIPLVVAGSTEAFDIINVLPRLHALDEGRTVGGRWPDDSPKASEWLYVAHAALKPSVVADHSVFRVHGPLASFFCSEHVRDVLQPQEWTGFVFRSTLPGA